MVKIGLFARLSQLSIRMLRHYDEIGLLKPAFIDDESGYRHYTLDQLADINRIIALKDMGFSLDQITQLTRSKLSYDQFVAMLEEQKQELKRRIQSEEDRLLRVEARLKLMQKEGSPIMCEIVIKKVAPQLVLSVQDIVPDFSGFSAVYGRLFGELMEHMAKHNGQYAGPAFARYPDEDTMMKDANISVEACVAIASPIPETGRIRVYQVEGCDIMACALHHGAYDELGPVHEALLRWIEDNGYHIAGPAREVYIRLENNMPPSEYITEVQYPIMKK